MEWTEEEKGRVWRSGAYKIVKGERYRNAAIVADAMRALGPSIYHCYDENGIYTYQASELKEAKRRLEKLKTKKS